MCDHHTIIKDSCGTSTCATCHIFFDKCFKQEVTTTNYNGLKINLLKTKSSIISTLENNFRINDVSTLNITEKIFNLTTKKKLVKGDNKKSILCASLYYAYHHLEKPVDFQDLLLKFNITYKTGLKGLRLCQVALQTCDKTELLKIKGQIHSFTATHKEKLENLIRKYDIPLKYYDEIEKIIIACHLKKNKILNDRMNNLWFSCIFYWLIKINPCIDAEEFISINDFNISLKKLKSDITYLNKNL